ncbi:Chromosomal replication initiator DnaA domain protein [Hippea maritima DSM 10411]|uniref:Chromosomal replication initiator DnaA domain protein n=1 Tax=Hippea maritima (strain ATCC 700847 / DSM 10411 / MH2) TaxID=760142 RepID=F2LUY1_HIPMA|nr:Chromosomal replication initiator DnaA domain protein [Hippea maritima DSM 10411]AEA34650.1 Chromosomal replication initiator DnaA domain protein [Hippea maritima DSM 10411]
MTFTQSYDTLPSVIARPLRISFENAFYHITARGIRRENIFYSDKDKYVFIDKMNETFEKYSFVCYAYCLMDNHYHLFIKTPSANISEGMHYLNTSYANWFRAKYKLVGSIFQGRYKSIVVDADSYALVLSAYIHLNPARAGMVDDPDNYHFSSFLDYIGKKSPLVKRLDVSFILSNFSDNEEQAQKQYMKYVIENADLKNPLEKSYKNLALGSEKFIEKIKEKISKLSSNREISHIKGENLLPKERVINAVSTQFNIKQNIIFKKIKGNIYRKLTLYLLKKYTPLSLKEIGELFNIDYSAVSQTVKRFEKEMRKDKITQGMVEKTTKEMERK